MKNRLFVLLLVLSLFTIGCNDKTSKLPEKEKVEVKADAFEKAKVVVKIDRLEREMFNFKSKADVIAFLNKHPQLVKEYFEIPNAANEAPFVDQLYQMYTNPELKKFYLDNEKFYGDFSDLNTQMNDMFSYVKYYYPKHHIPQINTIVTGFRFDQDFAFSDSLVVIGIDYFLGKGARYRPEFFDYMLRRYTKPHMVPMMGLAIASKYDEYEPKDETLIAEMIYYGKAHYFLERVMPELPDSLNIQFTSQEMIDTDQNVDVIWGHFIEKKLLFETNHKTKQRYVGESPKVVVIGDKCPGRIGRWLGWQIVRKYMRENPNVTLQELMKDKDAQGIFKKSKFKIQANS